MCIRDRRPSAGPAGRGRHDGPRRGRGQARPRQAGGATWALRREGRLPPGSLPVGAPREPAAPREGQSAPSPVHAGLQGWPEEC
eukprot:985931-Alexandrium_andersonii.AAC.1